MLLPDMMDSSLDAKTSLLGSDFTFGFGTRECSCAPNCLFSSEDAMDDLVASSPNAPFPPSSF